MPRTVKSAGEQVTAGGAQQPLRFDRAPLRGNTEALHRRLRELAALPRTDAESDRENARAALAAVIWFLRGDGRGERLSGSLELLFAALLDLDDGYVPPLLRPAKTKVRSRSSLVQDSTHAAACAALDVLQSERCGLSSDEAATKLARVLNKYGVRARSGGRPPKGGDNRAPRHATDPITSKTILNWRLRLESLRQDSQVKRIIQSGALLEGAAPDASRRALVDLVLTKVDHWVRVQGERPSRYSEENN